MTWQASDFAFCTFVRPRRRPPAQTGVMTLKKLERLIAAGYGEGHRQNYKPWLRVTKYDYSPHSFMGHLPSKQFARLIHFRSIAERKTILLARWLGAYDIRENFPIWPWPHSHPGNGLPGYDQKTDLPGLEETARRVRIDHGTYPGTSQLLYIATVDVMTTWKLQDNSYVLIAIDCKPAELVYSSDLKFMRMKERLQLVRSYFKEADIPYVLIHAELFPTELMVNLDLLEPDLSEHEIQDLRMGSTYQQLVDHLRKHAYQTAPATLIQNSAKDSRLPVDLLTKLLWLALWTGDVDHDLSIPYKPWQPLAAGGAAVRQKKLQELLLPVDARISAGAKARSPTIEGKTSAHPVL